MGEPERTCGQCKWYKALYSNKNASWGYCVYLDSIDYIGVPMCLDLTENKLTVTDWADATTCPTFSHKEPANASS